MVPAAGPPLPRFLPGTTQPASPRHPSPAALWMLRPRWRTSSDEGLDLWTGRMQWIEEGSASHATRGSSSLPSRPKNVVAAVVR